MSGKVKIHTESRISFQAKVKSYATFMKLRLSFLVVLSAISGYLFAGGRSGTELLYLCFGGFLVTGASNGFNQVIEKDLDSLMNRTKSRPLPTGMMSEKEGIIFALLQMFTGLILLYQINLRVAILGFFALFLYVAIYTPFKRISPWAVFVGAFPGAIPPMLGVVAVTNEYGLTAGILFLIQFIWQFPHFWAIAWVCDEDYARAGFRLLPSKKGKNKTSALIIMLYTLIMVPVSLLPWALDWTGYWTLLVITIAGAWFFQYAYRLYHNPDDQMAKKLMFASFLYLPIIQFCYVFDKI